MRTHVTNPLVNRQVSNPYTNNIDVQQLRQASRSITDTRRPTYCCGPTADFLYTHRIDDLRRQYASGRITRLHYEKMCQLLRRRYFEGGDHNNITPLRTRPEERERVVVRVPDKSEVDDVIDTIRNPSADDDPSHRNGDHVNHSVTGNGRRDHVLETRADTTKRDDHTTRHGEDVNGADDGTTNEDTVSATKHDDGADGRAYEDAIAALINGSDTDDHRDDGDVSSPRSRTRTPSRRTATTERKPRTSTKKATGRRKGAVPTNVNDVINTGDDIIDAVAEHLEDDE